MRYSYNSILKQFIKEYHQTHFTEIRNNKMYDLYNSNHKVFTAIEYLSSKDLIRIQKDVFGNPVTFELTDNGISYFFDKRIKRIEYIKELLLSKITDVVISFLVALITALIVA